MVTLSEREQKWRATLEPKQREKLEAMDKAALAAEAEWDALPLSLADRECVRNWWAKHYVKAGHTRLGRIVAAPLSIPCPACDYQAMSQKDLEGHAAFAHPGEPIAQVDRLIDSALGITA